MQPRRIIDVSLPPGADPDDKELDLLRAAFQVIAALRLQQGTQWKETMSHLELEGWTVRWSLTWRAEAKRGEEYEEATGASLDEALSRVSGLVMADTVGRVP